MDKNYSVDDILLDIKSKKMRRKEEGGQPARPSEPEEQFPGMGLGGQNGVAFAPDPSAPKDFLADQTPKDREPKSDFADEILEKPFDTAPFSPVRVGPQSIEDLKKPAPEKKRNPMDFTGHIRPITERAKIRKNKNATARKGRREDFSVVDFAKFHGGQPGANMDDTQAIPRLGASRELDMEELRNLDFSAADYGSYYDDDYDDDDFKDDETHRPSLDVGEYNRVEDRRDVAIDIARTKLWLVIRATATFLLTFSLVYLVLCGRFLWPLPPMLAPENYLRTYLLWVTGLTVAIALVGSATMGGGLIGLLKMRSNSDTLAALAMLAAIGQCVFALTRLELVNVETLTFYTALAAISMLFNALGKLGMISRIQANFKIISSAKSKKAVLLADDERFVREYLKGATRKPSIAFSAKCSFFTDFLALSFSDKYDVGVNKIVAPVCLLGAGVVGVLTYILTRGDSMMAVAAIVAILCIASTFSATFIENVPLAKLTRKLAPRGGMVSGNKAVEDFCDISAIVLEDKDLFPTGNMEIHGIKTYSGGRVDEVILDAASISYAMNSALSDVFLKMIGGNKKLLRKVDRAIFEDGRGITAWIDERRVLLGNRKLMEAHSIILPEPGYENKYADQRGEPLFLASAGELSAQLVVGYKVDEELALELDRLAVLGKLLIIRTIDANLTAHKVWEMYGYPENLVRIMPTEQHEQYEKMTAPRSSELAEIAYTGKASAMVGGILACVSARKSILSATMVQLIQIALGYGMVALLAFLGSMDTLTVLVLGVYQLFWFVVIGLVQRLRAA